MFKTHLLKFIHFESPCGLRQIDSSQQDVLLKIEKQFSEIEFSPEVWWWYQFPREKVSFLKPFSGPSHRLEGVCQVLTLKKTQFIQREIYSHTELFQQKEQREDFFFTKKL